MLIIYYHIRMRSITTIEKSFEMIDYIRRREGATVSEIADHLECSKSTAHYYLGTLEKHRFLVKGERGYQVGLRFIDIGSHALHEQPLYRSLDAETIREKVDQLATQTGETALICIEEYGKCYYVYRSQQNTKNRIDLLNEFSPLESAFGKAILAFTPEEKRSNIIGQAETDRLAADLRDELASIRENRVAYEKETDSRASLAAPILGEQDERVFGSVGIRPNVEQVDASEIQSKARYFTPDMPDLVKETALILKSQIYMNSPSDQPDETSGESNT